MIFPEFVVFIGFIFSPFITQYEKISEPYLSSFGMKSKSMEQFLYHVKNEIRFIFKCYRKFLSTDFIDRTESAYLFMLTKISEQCYKNIINLNSDDMNDLSKSTRKLIDKATRIYYLM